MTTLDLDERFLNFPPALVALIREYRATHNAELVAPIVDGIVAKYLPEAAADRNAGAFKSLNAFGLESLTLMEVILDIQDALGISLPDDELRGLSSFDDATALLARKVAALYQQPARS